MGKRWGGAVMTERTNRGVADVPLGALDLRLRREMEIELLADGIDVLVAAIGAAA